MILSGASKKHLDSYFYGIYPIVILEWKSEIMKPFLILIHVHVNLLNYIDIIYHLPWMKLHLLELLSSQKKTLVVFVALLWYKKCFCLKKFYYFMNKFLKIFIQFRYEIHHPRRAVNFHSSCCHWYLPRCCRGWKVENRVLREDSCSFSLYNLITFNSRLLSFVEF